MGVNIQAQQAIFANYSRLVAVEVPPCKHASAPPSWPEERACWARQDQVLRARSSAAASTQAVVMLCPARPGALEVVGGDRGARARVSDENKGEQRAEEVRGSK